MPLRGLSRVALYTSSQGSSASAAPAYGMVCSHASMVVSGLRTSHARRELVRAAGLHPLPKWSHCTAADSERYINFVGQRNGVCPPACVTSRSGRTSRPGDPCPNPQGAGADRPRCLLSMCAGATNSTPRRETCEDRHARLPCGDARSDQPRAWTVCCAVGVYPIVRTTTIKGIRLALTEPARGTVRQV